MTEPIFYRDIHPNDKEHTDTRGDIPILFVHGDFSDGASAWPMQLATLTPRYRLIAVDRRGYGASPTDPSPYTIASDAADALQVADLVGVSGFHLVGHSYGGMVAIEVARRAPGRVRSLHLIEPPYLSLLPDDPDVAAFLERTEEIFRRADEWGRERCTATFFEMIGGPKLVEILRSKPVWGQMVKDADRIAAAQPPSEMPPAVLDQLSIDGPIQLYTGGRSNPALHKIAYRLADIIPGCGLVDIPDAYHDVQRAGGAFNTALLSVTDRPSARP